MKYWLLSGLLYLSSLFTAAQAQRFTAVSTYSIGNRSSNPRGLATGDVNRDGYPDIVTANYVAAEAGVLLNQRNGTFAPVVGYTLGVGNSPYDITLGDFNQDGYPDLATANYLGRSLSVLLNRQDGTFGAPVAYSIAGNNYPECIVAADVNNDRYPDLLTANQGNTTLSVFINRRDGTFAFAQACAVAANSLDLSLAVGDLNHDGYLDVATACYGAASDQVSVLLNQRDGTFALLVPYTLAAGSQPFGIAVGDLNADGYVDILTANLGNNTVGTLLNQQDGTFGPGGTYPTGSTSQPFGIALADIDGDSQPDIVTSNIGTSTVGLLLNRQAGQFAPPTTYSTGTGSEPSRLVITDVDKDGKADVVTTNSASGTIGVLRGQSPLAIATPGLATPATSSLYPNPVSRGAVFTVCPSGLPNEVRFLEISLVNGLGQVVSQATSLTKSPGPLTLPTDRLAPGLYLVRILTQDSQRTVLGALPGQWLSIQ